jgi:capsule polysaccharide export protein KpsC/LpsZ
LIDNAVAVATVTGTAGWEAINRGTPAITFGSAWYRDAPGVYRIDTYSDLKESMESIRGLNTWNRKDIEEYVQKIISASYQGKINEATMPKGDQAETIFTAVNYRISN